MSQKTEFDLYYKKLSEILDYSRFMHSLGVAHTCVCLAMRYNYDLNKAYLAGLLHDCAKCIEKKEIVKNLLKYGIVLSDAEKMNPALWHAYYGPIYANELFGIEDEEILSAIRWHSTGKENMSVLEKIVYVADFIEFNRPDLESIEKIRKEAFRDLTHSVYLISEESINYLSKKKINIDSMTILCNNWLKENGIYDK